MQMIQRIILKFLDWVYFPIFRKYIPIKTFRYGATGGANMLFDWVLYFVFYNYVLRQDDLDLGFIVISAEVAAYLMVYPIILFTGMWLAKNITFQNSILSDKTQRLRYFIVTICNLSIKYAGLKGLVAIGIFPSISNAMMTVVTVIFSYIMQQNFTFKGNK